MTDKDPKDMTASELLREADSNPCSMCHLVMTGDESCATTGCASWAYRLADKIDAEIVKAYSEKLNTCAMRWAKANGWPDFKEGEDFGAWLDRCFIPRPRFEDGEPVQFGELVSSNLFGSVKVSAIEFTEDGTYVKDEPDGDWSTSLEVTTSRLKRPAPEALGADGKPIKVGDTVWLVDEYSQYAGSNGSANGNEYSLLGVDPQETLFVEYDRLVVSGKNYVRLSTCNAWCHVSWLTHTPPDTQERIDEDAEKFHCVYFGGYSACGTCPASTGELSKKSCKQQQIFDLLRRQRELDKRKGGAE